MARSNVESLRWKQSLVLVQVEENLQMLYRYFIETKHFRIFKSVCCLALI